MVMVLVHLLKTVWSLLLLRPEMKHRWLAQCLPA